MTNEDRKSVDEIRVMHDALKSHPYRVNREAALKRSYLDLYWECFEACRIHFDYLSNQPDVKWEGKITEQCFHQAYHDINFGRIDRIKMDPQRFMLFELTLSMIHTALDTGKVDYYWTYDTGVNLLKGLPRLSKWEYDWAEGKWHSTYNVRQLTEALADFKAIVEKNGGYDSLVYTETIEAWYKRELVYAYRKCRD